MRRSAAIIAANDAALMRKQSATPTVALDRTSLAFAATNTGSGFSNQTDTQTVRLAQTSGAAVGWTASLPVLVVALAV